MSEPKYNVIFRTCDSVQALRGARPFGLDKRTLIQICFLSLHGALRGFPHRIHVLGDKLSPEIEEFFGAYAERDSSITISNGDYGNDESIRQSISLALSFPDDEWVYFCEDDYLHQPYTFVRIDELIRNRSEALLFRPGRRFMRLLFRNIEQKPLFIHPTDYPDRYDPGHRQFSLIFMTKSCHWRQISSTTFTFLGEVKSLKKYERHLRESATGARDDHLSRHLFSHVVFRGRGLCVSPIPGLATHMTDGVMTPFVDWEASVHELLTAVRAL
jgi:hypothetical protein